MRSLNLYWVIMSCGWEEGRVLGCCTRGCLWGKNVLSEEALAGKFFQVPLEASTVGGLVSLTIVVRIIIFCSDKCRVMFDWLECLIHGWCLMALKISLMGSLSGGRLFRPVGSKWIWGENWVWPLLEGELPLILVTGMVEVSRCEFILSPSLPHFRDW